MNATFDDVADASALLAELNDLLETLDPVPADLAERAKFAISARALDAEIAALMTADLVTVRGSTAQETGRLFTTPGGASVLVDLSVDTGGRLRIDGWVTDGSAEISAYAAQDPLAVAGAPALARVRADDDGRFILTVPGGPVMLLVRPAATGAGAVLTPPLEL